MCINVILNPAITQQLSQWGWMIMDSFTIGNAKPSNMSRYRQNTSVRQATTTLHPSVVRSSACHKRRFQGPNVAVLAARATLQSGHHMCHGSAWSPDGGAEQCVQSETERKSFLRSEKYNAPTGSQIKPVCFSWKTVEVFGFKSTPPLHHTTSTPLHLLQWKLYGVLTFLILTQGGYWQKTCFIVTEALVWPTYKCQWRINSVPLLKSSLILWIIRIISNRLYIRLTKINYLCG